MNDLNLYEMDVSEYDKFIEEMFSHSYVNCLSIKRNPYNKKDQIFLSKLYEYCDKNDIKVDVIDNRYKSWCAVFERR